MQVIRPLIRRGGAQGAGFALMLMLGARAFAQSSPFGVGRPPGAAAGEASGIAAWLLQQQAAFHKAMTQAIGAVQTDPAALFGLLGIAFAYGLIHAIGPGHGKAVIASYLIANETALRRGAALAFGAALVQALIAILVVGLVALLIGGGAARIESIVRIVESVGFAIILAMGLWIALRKLRALAAPGGVHDPACDDPHCGHHMTGDARLVQNASRGELVMTAIGAGIRPCSGAIILLVFALAKGLFLAGAASVAAMALGTAIGTSAFALLAVKAKRMALDMISGSGHLSRIVLALEALAGLALAALGAALLAGMLAPGA